MSSGQHLSRELYDLIKQIGETRSKQEEDKIIQTDLQVLKTKINEKNIPPKKMKEYLIRAIYIEMLGHDASFSYIHAVNLSRDKTLAVKRIGYLASSLFFGPEEERLILLVATLQADLGSKNIYEVMAALITISKILSPFIVQAIVDPLSKLLNHANENIRKKAVMALQKVIKIAPTSVTEISDKINRALCDKDPSVMAASLNLFYDLVKQTPSKFKSLTNSFVVILKQVVDHKLAREYDYHRIPAPWIQIKLLQILAMLGANDQKTSEHIYEVLSQTLRRADDTGINIGYAITYQCVKTIATIYPNSQLLELASVSLARFLNPGGAYVVSFNNNLKYLGINALISIVAIDPKYALEHQMIVVDCLESRDETLKRETLDLLYRMTNVHNIETIADKLLEHLKNANDPHFKKELVNKITQLAERYAPSNEWYINIMSAVLENGSEHIDSNILNNMLKLIEENISMNPGFGEFLIQTYLPQAQKETIPDVLAKIIAWVFGEVGIRVYKDQPDWIDGLAENLLTFLDKHFEDETTKGWTLASLSKLYTCPGINCGDRIQEKFRKYKNSKYLDLQQRGVEFQHLSEFGSSSDVDFDASLSFLDSYVELARRRGAQAYDPNKKTRGLLAGLTLQANTASSEAGELKVTPYSQSESKARATKEGGEATGIKVTSAKWTKEGYEEKKHESNINKFPQSFSGTQSKSISSKDIQSGGGGAFQGFGSQSMSGGGGTFTSNPTPAYHSRPPLEDPALKEMQKTASALFAGLGPKTGTTTTSTTTSKPTTTTPANPFGIAPHKPSTTTTFSAGTTSFGGGQKSANPFGLPPKQTTTTTPSTTTTMNKPQTQTPTPAASDINLLDLDFGAPTTTTTTQQSQPTTSSNSGGFDLLGGFGGGAPVQQQPSYVGKYSPVNINVEMYENYWNELPPEVSNNVQTNVKNLQDFKVLLQKINLEFVAEIEGEVLAAGQRTNGDPVLIYAKIAGGGVLEVLTKSTNTKNVEEFVAHLKEAGAA